MVAGEGRREGVQKEELPEEGEAAGMTGGVSGEGGQRPKMGSDAKARLSCQRAGEVRTEEHSCEQQGDAQDLTENEGVPWAEAGMQQVGKCIGSHVPVSPSGSFAMEERREALSLRETRTLTFRFPPLDHQRNWKTGEVPR